MAAAAPSQVLDFEALLSRDYRPARVSRLVINDLYQKQPTKGSAATSQSSWNTNNRKESEEDVRRKRADEETSRLVMSLVSQTPAFMRHLPLDEQLKLQKQSSSLLSKTKNNKTNNSFASDPRNIPQEFHLVNLMDWEKQIDWDGSLSANMKASDPLELIQRPRNPHLDNLTFDDCFSADPSVLLEKARKAPLILELSVAGQSVANHVYQNSALSAQRPLLASQTDEYQNRLDRDWSGHMGITSTAELSSATKVKSSSLHGNKEQMEAQIAERQKKRAEMAIDKTNRVTQAMATVAAMGGGRGRTITSSLMGPGGTERTGRPSRLMGSASHEAEYVEQLDLVTSHTLSRDLSKVMLRQFHRPKLPFRLVRPDMIWQFQIRYKPTSKKGTDESKSSYQSITMGTHPGALSKSKIRTESDLSPTEGNLILIEYSEERPPIFLTKGMASKIVNYYRGDKTHCPVSAGGGDRPARRKRDGETKDAAQGGKDRLPRLEGPNRKTSILDWVGKLPKRSQRDRSEQEAIDILPEGVTEILHPKQHGPFLGDIEEGATVTGMITNLFVAPMFRHEPESSDFLMILNKMNNNAASGERDVMGVVLRDFPTSCFTVGQTEPRARVHAPNSQGERNFLGPWISYQIARALTRSQANGGGLSFEELHHSVLPNLEIPANTLRQRLKQVAEFDKNTQIWTTKPIGCDDYQGLEAFGNEIPPEGEACFDSARAASRRLSDLGLNQLISGTHTVASVGLTFVYLVSQLNTIRELTRKTKKLAELSRSNKSIQPAQLALYEKAASELESLQKSLRQKHEIAKFIYEELQLTPWHLTGEFIEVHKKGDGTGMMKLTGLGDPSGQGEGFSFLREVDSKPVKSIGANNDALSEQVKKITGTDCDLRKLTMKQMAALLRHYGMDDKYINTLKRWDRVHVIRDLSTKFASDGVGDGLERFARGEKLKLSEQKQMYHDRIQVIWKRQLAALSMDTSDKAGGAPGPDGMITAEANADDATALQGAQLKSTQRSEKDEESSDSDSDDDDDLAAALEEEMIHRAETNELVAAHGTGGKDVYRDLNRAAQDKDLTTDAREFAALKRQREEDRQTQEGLQAMGLKSDATASGVGRQVIRKRVTKTHPDGRQTITFKFIVQPNEVGRVIAHLQSMPKPRVGPLDEAKLEQGSDEKPPGHAMFQDEDDFEYSSKGRMISNRRRVPGKKKEGQANPRGRVLQLGKLKTKVSTEERMRKRQREEDEMEVYSVSVKRKGTSNRRERGSIRDRRPHVIFAERLESIRASLESRPMVGPFLKPVNRKLIPNYYEAISHPIDLSTIRDKINRYEYRTADGLVKDFELMKDNAAKFNGPADVIAVEAAAIFEFVRDQIESQRAELSELEEAVKEQMEGKPKKKRKKNEDKKSKASYGNAARVSGFDVMLGDVSHFHGGDSDSDESFSGAFNA
ncbi:hypothetical protein MPSEU_000955600 [Mayamaea pseudoterrestris]|nr:hypothetical protein MPSEU_000955600 [Mayamaea pseudoterrestris]